MGFETPDVLNIARRLAVEVLEPHASATDTSAAPPREGIERLASAGLLGLSIPREYGGLESSPATLRRVLEIIASGCGTTAFVYFQHLVGCRHIAGGENTELAARVLPALASGERFCSLAFSHLRRPGPPVLRVSIDASDFVFDGTAPWTTGAGLADVVLLAGTHESGDSIWAVVPLADGGGLTVSEPMQLAAANASSTVSLSCEGLRVGSDSFVKRVSASQLAAETAGAILFFTALSLGVATRATELVAERLAATGSEGLVAAELSSEIERAREAVDACAARAGTPGFDAEALDVRAWCIDLGVRTAHAAVIASGGRANLLVDPAQRLLREAMLYTLTAQTPALRQASLERIRARGG